jgi:hypothetical protein
MEYRKKHLKPRTESEFTLQGVLMSDKFHEKIEFVCTTRKQMFLNQKELGIKPAKECTVTEEGMTLFLNEYLTRFVKLYYSKPTFSTTANAYFKRDPPNFLAQLDMRNHMDQMKRRVAEAL